MEKSEAAHLSDGSELRNNTSNDASSIQVTDDVPEFIGGRY